MQYPIEIHDLKKTFYVSPYCARGPISKILDCFTFRKDRINVLDGLSLKIKKGEIYGLLGPNAVGKTTLIRILSTTVAADGGKVLVNGLDVSDSSNKDRISASLGVMLGARSRSFYWRLTAKQNLDLYATLYGVEKEKQEERIAYLLDFVGLEERKDDVVYSFSTGMLNRLAIARAFVHSPKILLLDEFMGNLDPKKAFEIRNIIKRLARTEGKTILFTTHNPYEAESMSDRIGILNRGRIIEEGSPSELKRKYGSRDAKVTITLEKFPKDKKKFLDGLRKYAKTIKIDNNVISIATEKTGENLEGIIRVANQAKMCDMDITPPSLENAFIKIVEADNGL